MRPIRRILAAIKDPTAKSLHAVRKAAQLAQAYGADLELFHGISTPLFVDAYSYERSLPEIEKRMRSESIRQLERIAAKLRRPDLKVTVAAEWDFPAYEAVVRHAIQTCADLIVAQCHATRHIAPGLLKITDWELLRTSPVPVLLVKTPGSYRRPAVLAAVDPAHACSKPAKLDDEILRVGRSVATALHGALHAVHAYLPVIPPVASPRMLSEQGVKKFEAQAKATAAKGFARTVRSAEIPQGRRHLIEQHPINAIEQTARKTHSAIVVMGAISRSGLKRFFFGNTAEELLDSLPCDLLIVKPADFGNRIPRSVRGVRFAATPVTPFM